MSTSRLKTITNTDSTGATKQVQTYVGASLGTKLRRFLVGPVECEITGLAESPDGRALFLNIQHPGEDTAASDIGSPALFTSHSSAPAPSPSASTSTPSPPSCSFWSPSWPPSAPA